MGRWAAKAITVVIIVSALGSLNGIVLAGPRVYYAMAQDGLAFRWMGTLHPKRQTPYLAIAAQAVWSCVLAATNSYRALFSRVIYTEWLFFALLAAGIFRAASARRVHAQISCIWLIRCVPAVSFVTSAAIAVNQIWAAPRDSFIGLGLLLLGLPVYFFWAHRNTNRERS